MVATRALVSLFWASHAWWEGQQRQMGWIDTFQFPSFPLLAQYPADISELFCVSAWHGEEGAAHPTIPLHTALPGVRICHYFLEFVYRTDTAAKSKGSQGMAPQENPLTESSYLPTFFCSNQVTRSHLSYQCMDFYSREWCHLQILAGQIVLAEKVIEKHILLENRREMDIRC